MKAPLPPNEMRRLEALRQCDVLDTPAEPAFDDLTLLAAHICQTPIALVVLVDETRQWFKSTVGMDAAETPRDIAFSAHTILNAGDVLEVRDASLDPRFAENPLVTSDPHIRFYAGVPLVTQDGQAVGSLCVIDQKPRALTAGQLAALRTLGRQVVAQLELRRQAGELVREAVAHQRTRASIEQQVDRLAASKQEADRLLALGEQSRRALLSVLEDEKLTGEHLRESEELNRIVLNSMAAHIAVLDRDGHIIAVNDAWRQFARDNASTHPVVQARTNVGINYLEVCRSNRGALANEAERAHDGVRKVLRGEHGSFTLEYPCHSTKEQRWFVMTVTPLKTKSGGAVIAHHNITQGKKDQETLRLLSSAIEQSTESVVITDAQLEPPGPTIVFVNPAFTKMTGYSAAEVIGKTPRILPGPKTDRSVVQRLREHLARGQAFGGEAINYRKDGTDYHQEWQIGPIRDAKGSITHFVAHQRNISERRQLEEQFRQSHKMEGIGQLAGGVAHDFNNILAAIQMAASLLPLEGELSPAQMELTGEILASVERAAALTLQLLLFSRQEVMRQQDLDLNQSIVNIAKMLHRTLGEEIETHLKLAPQPMCLSADPGMMDQVLLNLSVNARDAMPKGGALVFETDVVEFDESGAAQHPQGRPGSFVRLCVSDTGSGIPADILPKIFEPFFTTKEVGKGTGLGLATVFGIVQQHHGWINVDSNVGHGTIFRIYLPRLEHMPARTSSDPQLTAVTGGEETILLVEDDKSLNSVACKALTRLGYRVRTAFNGPEALKIWQEHRAEIHLVLTDLVMPGGMNGIELGEQLLRENPQLKIIYVSGYSGEVAGQDVPRTEGGMFLAKPFQLSTLARTVRAMLDA